MNRVEDKHDSSVKLDSLINQKLEKAERLKESLKHASSFTEEMALVRNLSKEISELRELRDRRLSEMYH